MTLDEFFAQARMGREWSVQEDRFGYRRGLVVRCASGLCPMAAVATDLVPSDERHPKLTEAGVIFHGDAKRILGFDFDLVKKIADAADDESSPDREWLLKNLGVATPPTTRGADK